MLDVRELAPGMQLDHPLAVRAKRGMGQYKGGYFYTLVLGNATGELVAKVWQGPDEDAVREAYQAIEVGDVVEVRGNVNEYRGAIELSLEVPPARLEQGAVDPRDYLPASPADTRVLARRLVSAARAIEDHGLRQVVLHVWEDPDLQARLLEAPASKGPGGDRLGGLVERMYRALGLVDLVCRQRETLDRDLLTAGVLLHDLGALREYAWGGAIEVTPEGRLLGRGVLGDERLRQALDEVEGIAPGRARALRHLVLAQRGPGTGAPGVEPRTPEAYVLAQVLSMDRRTSRFLAGCRALEREGVQEGWSREAGQYVVLA